MKNLKLNVRPLEGAEVSCDTEMLYIQDLSGVLCIAPNSARQIALLKGGELIPVQDGKKEVPITYGEAFMRFDAGVCTISIFS